LLDDGRALLATETGELVSFDHDGHRAVWFAHASRPVDIARDGTWVTVAYADDTVIRYDSRTGTAETTTIPSPVELRIAIAADGTVFAGAAKTVLRWQRDGMVLVHTTLPEAIEGLIPMAHHVLLRTRDGGTFTITHDVPAQVKTLPAGTVWGFFAGEAELGITDSESGELAIVDVVSGTTWPAAMPAHGTAVAPQVSSSGRLAGSIIGPKLYIWDLDVPATAADTARWLDTLTNATAELGTSTLTFH